MSFSVVIPAFNEASSIKGVLTLLKKYLEDNYPEAEVIVVNDGSTDNTAEIVGSVSGVRLLSHPRNKGYGSALKTGIREAKNDWCITYDADGQHTPDLIPLILDKCQAPNNMVVGRREKYQGPWVRRPGKWLLQLTANWLSGVKVPDLNSGLRAFRRADFLKYKHLFPNGFSLSTTSTICFFRENLNVVYVPISIQPRTGKSTVTASDAPRTFMLILRLIMLFSPLRIFLPASILFTFLTIVDVLIEYWLTGSFTNKSAIALFTLTSMTFFFGLLADQIAIIRREIGR